MIDDKDILEWTKKELEKMRINATRAYERNDLTAFLNINVKIRYYKRYIELLEEKVNGNANAD